MKHESMQLRASANRSSRACSRQTISGKFSSARPQPSSRVLWTMTSMRRQAATVQLKDRQIIGRSLDRDFPLCCALFARAIVWTALASKDCLDGLQVQPHATAVNQSLKDLFHVAANVEDEVAAVLNLVV